MGLTKFSMGKNAVDKAKAKWKTAENGNPVIALAGSPNVGKSSVFNRLTGMSRHTGNWAGKTVSLCMGQHKAGGDAYNIVDLPGCYSMKPNSEEEKIARDFLLAEKPDAVIIVCDATSLKRSFSLVLQTLEITENAVVCLNLIDEARKKRIEINDGLLSERLGIPVVPCSAKTGEGLKRLIAETAAIMEKGEERKEAESKKTESRETESRETESRETESRETESREIESRETESRETESRETESRETENGKIESRETESRKTESRKTENGKTGKTEKERAFPEKADNFVSENADAAEKAAEYLLRCREILRDVVKAPEDTRERDFKIDKAVTGKFLAFPLMLLMLTGIFYLTIKGANYPSELLSAGLFKLEGVLRELFVKTEIHPFITDLLLTGVYRTLAWVISVMLPPMAIFFPLFTLLEDLGYLPRAAFNLDRCFRKCSACGKQALTMCMGFGCNAAGVVGCRIISSPRERLIAILTNAFVPCNGRFPMLIAVISLFFASASVYSDIIAAGTLALVIIFSVGITLLVSFILSKTLLKGQKSSFTLELPPYRAPRVGQVIIRSIFDRTLYVLGRAAVIAAPAGLIIFLLANIHIGSGNLISAITGVLDPFGWFLGLDGVILLAFILGFPANELVIPLMLMAYTAGGSLTEMSSLAELQRALVQNGWNSVTAVSFILFAIMHAPCGTTCLTIKKETGSVKWALLGMLIPTLCGIISCALFNGFACLIGLK